MDASIPRRMILLLGFLALVPFSTLQAQEDPPVNDIAPGRIPFNIDGHDLEIPYYGNHSLADVNDNVTRAVVVVHGSGRGAGGSYTSILNPAIEACGADGTTFILAPQFLEEVDIDSHGLPDNVAYWSGWERGSESLSTGENPRPAVVSSYAVMDITLLRLAENNPNLKTIVVAGHSGGGQFVNRFAAGSEVEQTLAAVYGINLRYIVANPRSYVYFNEERPVAGTVDQFAVPDGAACPAYNEYKYGLDDLNSYMSNAGTTQIRAQYQEREVAYLLGGDDILPPATPTSCECCVSLEGKHRLERGVAYYNHLADFFGPEIRDWHRLAIIPNVGHSQGEMFASQCGKYYLFDYGSCNSIDFSAAGPALAISAVGADIQSVINDPGTPAQSLQLLEKALVSADKAHAFLGNPLSNPDYHRAFNEIKRSLAALEKAALNGAATDPFMDSLRDIVHDATQSKIAEAVAKVCATEKNVQKAQGSFDRAVAEAKISKAITWFTKAFKSAAKGISTLVNLAGNWAGTSRLKREGTSEKVAVSMSAEQSQTNVTGIVSVDRGTEVSQGDVLATLCGRIIEELNFDFSDGSFATGSGKTNGAACKLTVEFSGTDSGGPFTAKGTLKKQ